MQQIKTMVFLLPILIGGFALWRACLAPAVREWANWRMAGFIGLTVVGFLAPNIWVYYAAVFLLVALLPRSRIEAMCTFILVVLMLPSALKELTAGSTSLFTFDTAKCAGMGLLCAFRFPAGPNRRGRRINVYDLMLVGMMGLAIAIVVRVPDPTYTNLARFVLFVTIGTGVPYLMLRTMRPDSDDMRRALHTIALAGFILALVASFETVRHWPLYQSFDGNLHTNAIKSKTLLMRGGLLRSSGPYLESTGFGVCLAVMIVIAAAQRSLFRTAEHQMAVVLVGCCGLVATLARGGWVGLIVGLVLLGLYRGKALLTAGTAVTGGLTAMFIYAALPENSKMASLVGKSGHAATTTDYREDLFNYCVPLIKQKPVFGWRMADVRVALKPVLHSDTLSIDWVNSYLYFAVGGGLVGLAVAAVFLWWPIVTAWSKRRRALRSRIDMDCATAVFAGSGAFAVMITSVSYADRIPLMGVLLFACARTLALRLSARQATLSAPTSQGVGEPGRAPAPVRRPLVVDPSAPVWAGGASLRWSPVPAAPLIPGRAG